MSPAARILVVRHGETASNAARIFQTPDTPLSELGREQAARLGRRLRVHPVARVLASDLTRAVETAEAVCATTRAALSLDPLLQERNFGRLRGTAYADFAGDPFASDYTPPEGESWADFHARVDAAWSAIANAAAEGEGDLVVVTHGLVCRAIAQHKLALEGLSLEQVAFANTSVTIVEASVPWRALRLACTEHLDELSRSTGGGRA